MTGVSPRWSRLLALAGIGTALLVACTPSDAGRSNRSAPHRIERFAAEAELSEFGVEVDDLCVQCPSPSQKLLALTLDAGMLGGGGG